MQFDAENSSFYEFADFRVDAQKRILWRGGERITLTPKVFETLLVFLEHRGEVLEKDYLMNLLWNESFVEESNLIQNVAVLRRALGENSKEHKFILTVPGRGYKFVAEVIESPSSKVQSPRPSEESGVGSLESDRRILTDKVEEQIPKTEIQIAKDDGQRTNDEKQSRFWLLSLGVLSALVLSSLGFYLWRDNAAKAHNPQIKTIAVLPFKPLVPENRNEALELGMADTLISRLSGEEVSVRPLSAIRRFNSIEQDSVAAGRELRVEAVLDGSIQIAGDRVRVSAKLLRVGDGQQLWAGQFDEMLTDIFAVQDSISAKVASALRISLVNQHSRPTRSVEAYQLYMNGNLHTSKLVLPEVQKGISYYEQAIAADPEYALAYVGMTNAYRAMVLTNDARPSEIMPKAKAAAQKAIAIDASLAEAWSALAIIDFLYDFDAETAEGHTLKGLELDPNSSQSHFNYAHLLSNTGRHAEALAEIKRARELDPVSLVTNALEGQILFFAGKDDEALKILQSTAEMDPNFWLTPLFMSRIYLRKEMYGEAIAAATKARDLTRGNAEATASIGYALAISGQPGKARKVLKELESIAATRFVPSYALALIHNALGDKENALDLLEKAFDEREPLMIFLKVEPKWDNLRSDPRFVDLMKRMNFE